MHYAYNMAPVAQYYSPFEFKKALVGVNVVGLKHL